MRGEQFFFVNKRFIKDAYLNHAVTSCYENLLPKDQYPFYVLHIDIDPAHIDVNIHPTKTEIKFDDDQALYAILRSAIKHSLGQFNVAPALDFDRDPNLDTPYEYQNKTAKYPTIQVNRTFNPFSDDKKSNSISGGNSSYKKVETTQNWESLYVGLKQETFEIDNFSIENDEVTASFFDEKEEEQTAKHTYQIQKKYIVSPIKSGMVIINQNRAHQRVLYEQFLTNMTVQQAASQQLLFPLAISFSANELKIIAEMQPALEATGFVFDWESEQLQVLGIPSNTNESEVLAVLEQLVSDLQDGIPDSSFSQNDTIAKSMAKSLAVKTGMYLTEKEQENLVNNLFACKDPNVSPFQKPTFITLRVEDIDKRFTL
jgi:DNA mismatch repair protein MutL